MDPIGIPLIIITLFWFIIGGVLPFFAKGPNKEFVIELLLGLKSLFIFSKNYSRLFGFDCCMLLYIVRRFFFSSGSSVLLIIFLKVGYARFYINIDRYLVHNCQMKRQEYYKLFGEINFRKNNRFLHNI